MNIRRYYWAVLMLLILGGAWLCYSAAYHPRDGAIKTATLKSEIVQYRRHNARMKLEITEMRTLVNDIKTNPQRLEEVARRRLQMIKNDEVFVLPDNNQ